MNEKPLFYQMFEQESSTYTYLLADQDTKEAVLIDPVLETIERDLKLIEELNLKLLYVLDTHIHADHITGADLIRKRTGVKTCVSKNAGVSCADILLEDGQEIKFGKHTITALATPGHTDSCITYKVGDMLFTGDTLLIRGNGRTDFQQGSSEKLYDSIQRLFNLNGEYVVYPAHDYKGQTKTTIELEKKYNPRIGSGRSKAEFVKIMSELKLDNPKKIMEAVSANMVCGRTQEESKNE
jgi:sulfur dioxygenase